MVSHPTAPTTLDRPAQNQENKEVTPMMTACVNSSGVYAPQWPGGC